MAQKLITKEIEKKLNSREEVLEVKYVSAEEAWEQFQKEYFGEDSDAAAGFEENPLENSDNFEVYMKDIEQQKSLVKYAEGLEGVRIIQYDNLTIDKCRELGVRHIGENRVQELTDKLPKGAYTGKPVHFIGHLQTNKVKQVVGKVDVIQSVDRINLMEAIQKEAAKQGIIQDIYLEINIGNEASKSGFLVSEVFPLLEHISEYPNIFVRGLMAIPPISQKDGENRLFSVDYPE